MANLRVLVKSAEVRGMEKKTGKDGKEFLVIKIDDEAGNRHEFLDRDIENEKLYKRGVFYDFEVAVAYGFSKTGGNWCRFNIESLKALKRDE